MKETMDTFAEFLDSHIQSEELEERTDETKQVIVQVEAKKRILDVNPSILDVQSNDGIDDGNIVSDAELQSLPSSSTPLINSDFIDQTGQCNDDIEDENISPSSSCSIISESITDEPGIQEQSPSQSSDGSCSST